MTSYLIFPVYVIKKIRHILFVISSLNHRSRMLQRIFLDCHISQGRTERSMQGSHGS